MKGLILVHTTRALAEYDAGEAERDAAFAQASTADETTAWLHAERAALDKVRRAFLEDTKDRNNWSQVQHVDLFYLREQVRKHGPKEKTNV